MKIHKKKVSRKTSRIFRFLRRCHQNLLTAFFMGPLFNPAAFAAAPSVAAGISPQPVIPVVAAPAVTPNPADVPNPDSPAEVIQPKEKVFFKSQTVGDEKEDAVKSFSINGQEIKEFTVYYRGKADFLRVYFQFPKKGGPTYRDILLPSNSSGRINGDSFARIDIGYKDGTAILKFYKDTKGKDLLLELTLKK